MQITIKITNDNKSFVCCCVSDSFAGWCSLQITKIENGFYVFLLTYKIALGFSHAIIPAFMHKIGI